MSLKPIHPLILIYYQEVTVEEVVEWLPSCPDTAPLTLAQLSDWMNVGPKKLDISDETDYCDAEVLQGVLSAKVRQKG